MVGHALEDDQATARRLDLVILNLEVAADVESADLSEKSTGNGVRWRRYALICADTAEKSEWWGVLKTG